MLRGLMLTAALIAGATALGAKSLDGGETYDLLFRNGTLDAVPRDATLTYRRDVSNALKPEAASRDSGTIALSISEDDRPVAEIDFRQGEQHRSLGTFPASVGNPMIMYFYESVVRDMAEAAGGSPFYIRNRVKEALIQPSEVTEGEAQFEGRTIQTQTVRMMPFAGDPNVERMKGFGDLELKVTMAEDVPGWYMSLTALAPGAEGADPVYRSEISFDAQEPGQ